MSSGAHPSSPHSQPESHSANKLPHYALPNFSVVLPTFSNHEPDVITQAFRVGSYVSLSDLPNKLNAGQVSRSRFQKILDNRQPSDAEPQPYKPKAKLFSEFEYVPSPFNLADDLIRAERKQSQLMIKEAHKEPFIMSDTSIKLKHEDAFHNKLETGWADPFESADDQALRYKWLQDAQILAGPWRPAGKVKGQSGQAATELPSRKSLPHMVDKLREAIEADWSEYDFLVCSTDDEHLVVRFEMSTLDSEPGLVAYMNMFSRSSHVVNELMLRKVVEDWNVTPGDGHLYFTFRPQWVSVRVTDTFFSLHPEQRVFQDARLKHTAAFRASAAAPADALAKARCDSPTGANGATMRPELS
ncbi:hypothetical protein AB1Y20_016577 [Prymnesium parvum]|uniref:Uncharacterized protein n=1 Tax=Prymnesium parvum TaxID=97485 RepID=A0AB34ICU4_PRYPA